MQIMLSKVYIFLFGRNFIKGLYTIFHRGRGKGGKWLRKESSSMVKKSDSLFLGYKVQIFRYLNDCLKKNPNFRRVKIVKKYIFLKSLNLKQKFKFSKMLNK